MDNLIPKLSQDEMAPELAAMLREAHAGGRLLKRCAWCGCLEVGGEWLHLEAIGRGQTRITTSLIQGATHGICPDCLQQTLAESDVERATRSGG